MNSNKLRSILFTTSVAAFMSPFMLSSMAVALPDIQKHFGCSATLLSWISMVFLLANAIVLLPSSKASDIFGREIYFKIGLYLFAFSTLIMPFSPNVNILLATRVVQGIGAAIMQVTGIAIVTSSFPPEKRGKVIGINVGIVYLGLSSGPFIGGMLIQTGGWQMLFVAAIPLCVISIILAHIFLPNSKRESQLKSFDWKGSLIYAILLLFLVYGGIKINTPHGISLFAIGIALTFVFLRYEKKLQNPMFPVKLLVQNKLFLYSNLAALIHYSATFGIGFLLSLYLQFTKGLSPRDAGAILIIQPVIMAIIAPIAGRLSDKYSPGSLATTGMLLTFCGLLLLLFLDEQTTITAILLILIFLGLGFGFFTSPNTNSIMSSVEQNNFGVAAGTSSSMRVVGQTFSMMLVTFLMTIELGTNQLSTETVPQFSVVMKIAFITFAILCALGTYFSINRKKINI